MVARTRRFFFLKASPPNLGYQYWKSFESMPNPNGEVRANGPKFLVNSLLWIELLHFKTKTWRAWGHTNNKVNLATGFSGVHSSRSSIETRAQRRKWAHFILFTNIVSFLTTCISFELMLTVLMSMYALLNSSNSWVHQKLMFAQHLMRHLHVNNVYTLLLNIAFEVELLSTHLKFTKEFYRKILLFTVKLMCRLKWVFDFIKERWTSIQLLENPILLSATKNNKELGTEDKSAQFWHRWIYEIRFMFSFSLRRWFYGISPFFETI